MANPAHVEILKQGVEVWNEWRTTNPDIIPDLFAADLTTADLSNANLSNANFRRADLSSTTLSDVNFRHTDLSGANFSSALIRRADFSGAYFYLAVFKGINFEGTNFSEAQAYYTSFDSCNLGGAIGLELVHHPGPSTIGIDTIYLSGGNIPEVFLRGCGLSDWEIENAKLFNPDLSNNDFIDIQYRMRELRFTQAIQIKPLFISYSHSDSAFVDHIENHLNQRGIRFWRDIHNATSGRLERQIDQAIRSNPVVLLVLSANSVESDWVQHEARLARKREQETKTDVLCPIALDDAWTTGDWPERLREQIMEYNILDFSQWQDAAQFDRMFARLIEGLAIFYK